MRTKTAVDGRPRQPDSANRAPFVLLQRGTKLGGYQLLSPIAAGGMAYVWTAARSGDYGFRRLFAIKVMREEIAHDATFVRMFLEEAKLAALIRHSHVVEVIELGEEAGRVYQVMPLVEGDSLSRLKSKMPEGGAVPPSVAVRIMVDALRGLHAAHEVKADDGRLIGIVHRDVSPQNILVGSDGISKIADFGIAKAVLAANEHDTEAGAVRGKLSYMSPEQLSQKPLDRRSDLFAVGIVLWELFMGEKLPQPAASLVAANLAIPSPRIDTRIAQVVLKALAREPADRYDSADAMADALEAAARSVGYLLSAKEVSQWVTDLLGGTLERRREELTVAITHLRATTTEKHQRSGRRLAVRGALAGVAVIGLLGVGARWARSRETTTPPPIVAPVIASKEDAPKEAPPPAAAPPPSPVTPPATASASAPRNTRSAPAHRPRPMFGNPYAH